MDDECRYNSGKYEDMPNELSDGDQLLKDERFDKALIDFYMKHKLKSLKRKITSNRMNEGCATNFHQAKRARQEKSYATISTRYSGTYFSSVLSKLTLKQKAVIIKYGMECLLNFQKTDVPIRFVKWIAGKFDTRASEIQIGRKFIPVTKQTIHNILDLPIGGIQLVPDCEAGRDFLLTHFNVTSIPSVNFFANKLCSGEELSDEDIFICFMSVAFTCFLCPNSSLQPSTQYFHIFKNCDNVKNYDLSKFVYDWLVNSIASFQNATKITSKRSVTFGGCHYTIAVSYLDNVEFGLNSLPEDYPRIRVWTGNKVRLYSDMDKTNSSSYGKRPLKRLEPSSAFQVERSYGKDSCSKLSKTFKSPFNYNGKLNSLLSSHLTEEALQDIAHIVHSNSIGKPVEFRGWGENLVYEVLNFLHQSSKGKAHSASLKLSDSDNYAPSNNSIGNLFQFKFPSLKKHQLPNAKHYVDCETTVQKKNSNDQFEDMEYHNTPQCNMQNTEQFILDSGTISKGKLASGKYQHLSKILGTRFEAAPTADPPPPHKNIEDAQEY